MKYTTILFDADGTLLDFKRSEREALGDCLIARGITVTEDITKRYSDINDLHWKMLERGEITRSELYVARFEMFFHEYGFELDPVQMSRDYFVALSTKSYLIDGAYELCRELAKDRKLYLITNGDTRIQHGRFDPSPIAPFFDGRFISEEVGYSKPELKYFNYVMSHIPNFRSENTVVIGDSLTADIKGGINAGLDVCWYNPEFCDTPKDMRINCIAHNYREILDFIKNN